MHMSGLNMQSSQGSLNKAHSNALSLFAYQHTVQHTWVCFYLFMHVLN
jgi:hypothetical protein